MSDNDLPSPDPVLAADSDLGAPAPGTEDLGAVSSGPEPTPAEEEAAERAAATVDIPAVAAHEEEMNSIGANVKGEGQVEPE